MNDNQWRTIIFPIKKNNNTFMQAPADPWVKSKKKGKARPKKFHN